MKEQFVPVAPEASIVQVLARGVCPICTLMRSLRSGLSGDNPAVAEFSAT
jgi:hypothetical protein